MTLAEVAWRNKLSKEEIAEIEDRCEAWISAVRSDAAAQRSPVSSVRRSHVTDSAATRAVSAITSNTFMRVSSLFETIATVTPRLPTLHRYGNGGPCQSTEGWHVATLRGILGACRSEHDKRSAATGEHRRNVPAVLG